MAAWATAGASPPIQPRTVRLGQAASRQPAQDGGALGDIPERPRGRLSRIARLDRVHSLGAALEHDPLRIGDKNVLHASAEADELIQAGDRRRASAGAGDLYGADVLADQLEAVEDGCGGDDGGGLPVVMEHRDLPALPQRPLDGETLRGLGVPPGGA